MKAVILIIFLAIIANLLAIDWQCIEKGLDIFEFNILDLSPKADSTVLVIRIDPDLFKFNVYSEQEYDNFTGTAESWVESQDLILAVNGGLYEPDNSPTGYFKNYDFIGNPEFKKDYNLCFVCNPRVKNLPSAQLVDLEQTDADSLINSYNTVLQSLRMVDHNGTKVWFSERQVDIVMLGESYQGDILIIYTSYPYNNSELIDKLLSMDIGLTKLMYLEGLVHSFYFKYRDRLIIRNGKEKLDNIDLENRQFFSMPIAIGIKWR
ncbi:MAG: hypothetical protein JXB49_05715 [Bacteroidales bacterium]|nr:hypothetical protein [Bacteroidales bacterium]